MIIHLDHQYNRSCFMEYDFIDCAINLVKVSGSHQKNCSVYMFTQGFKKGIRARLFSLDDPREEIMGFNTSLPEGSVFEKGRNDGFYYLTVPNDADNICYYLSLRKRVILQSEYEALESSGIKGYVENFIKRREKSSVKMPSKVFFDSIESWLERSSKQCAKGSCLQNCLMLFNDLKKEKSLNQGKDYRFVRIDNNHTRIEINVVGCWVAVDLGGAEGDLSYAPVEKGNKTIHCLQQHASKDVLGEVGAVVTEVLKTPHDSLVAEKIVKLEELIRGNIADDQSGSEYIAMLTGILNCRLETVSDVIKLKGTVDFVFKKVGITLSDSIENLFNEIIGGGESTLLPTLKALVAGGIFARQSSCSARTKADIRRYVDEILLLTTDIQPMAALDDLTHYVRTQSNSNFLVLTGNYERDLAMVVLSVLSPKQSCAYYVDSPSLFDVSRSMIHLDSKGRPALLPYGRFMRFIKAASQNGSVDYVLVIAWDQLPSRYRVMMNTLFDANPSICGVALPKNVCIISLCQTMPSDRSFVSRHSSIIDYSDLSEITNLHPADHQAGGGAKNSLSLDLQGYPNWQEHLFGRVVLQGEQLVFLPSSYVLNEDFKDCSALSVKNVSEVSYREIVLFFQQACALGYIDYHGYRIPIESTCKLDFIDAGFNFYQFPECSVMLDVDSSYSLSGMRCVNSHLFDYLIRGKKIEAGQYHEMPGWIESLSGGSIIFVYY